MQRIPRPDRVPSVRRDVQRHERERLHSGFGGSAAVRIAMKALEWRNIHCVVWTRRDLVFAQGVARGINRAAPIVACSGASPSPTPAASSLTTRTHTSPPASIPTRTAASARPSARTSTSARSSSTTSRSSSAAYSATPSTPSPLTWRTKSGSALCGFTRSWPMWRSAEVDVAGSRRMWRSSDRGGGTFLESDAQLQNEELPQPYLVHILSLRALCGKRGGVLERSRYGGDASAAARPARPRAPPPVRPSGDRRRRGAPRAAHRAPRARGAPRDPRRRVPCALRPPRPRGVRCDVRRAEPVPAFPARTVPRPAHRPVPPQPAPAPRLGVPPPHAGSTPPRPDGGRAVGVQRLARRHDHRVRGAAAERGAAAARLAATARRSPPTEPA